MIFFMIKKAFFDMWDNLFAVVLMNLGFILLAAGPVFLPSVLLEVHLALSVISLIVGIMCIFIYAAAVALGCRELSDYRNFGFREFGGFVRESWKHGAVLGAICLAHLAIVMVAFPVYSGMRNIIGLVAMIVLFWASLIWLFSIQYFLPLFSRLDRSVPKIIKKCFILFFDNSGFTIFMGLGALGIFFLSGFTAFLLPGIATVFLWLQVGFKLRLLKYDYLEENPQASRRNIPWDALLVEDQERVGKRTLRGMIFPWKE